MKHTLLGFVTLFASVFCTAQEIALPEITPPSPTVANLMAFEEVPIDYYTGQPNISIPLCSKKLNGSLGMNVSLDYHTSGIKVDNTSGWTGTGWSLIAGGSISRTVRGIPDEFKPGPPPSSGVKLGVLHNDAFWNYDGLTLEEKSAFNWNAIGSQEAVYDTQLDLYQFNALGVSGRFVIINDAGLLKIKLLTRNQNIRITPNYDPTSFAISSFEIVDAYGNKYLFDEIETATSEPFSGRAPQGGIGTIQASGATQSYTNDTAWHLKTISTSNDIVLATLNYVTAIEKYQASFTRTTSTPMEQLSYEMLQNAYNQGVLEPALSISALNLTTDTKKLSTIAFKDGTSVEFIAANGHPEYFPGFGSTLSEVRIKKADGSENKKYTLQYETTDRLWLTTVLEQAGSITHTYALAYNNKEGLSPKSSALNVSNLVPNRRKKRVCF